MRSLFICVVIRFNVNIELRIIKFIVFENKNGVNKKIKLDGIVINFF